MSVNSIKQIAKDLLTLQAHGILKSPSLRSSFTSSYYSLDPFNSFVSDSTRSNIKSENNSAIEYLTKQYDLRSQNIPLADYSLNEDHKPKIIKKKSLKNLEYVQDIAIRRLRPPTPPAPGEIVITQEANRLTPPAPPIIIRQQPPRPNTPEPIVLRETPPKPPEVVGRKVITISGKKLPPPPRKVVVERLAPLPSKPQAIIAERWLPYTEVKRRVIFKPAPPDPIIFKPRNIVVQWTPPNVTVRQAIRYLGIVKANPAEYEKLYSEDLKAPEEFPKVIQDIKTPDGLTLAADSPENNVHQLEGSVEALKLVDMEREGLAAYIPQVYGQSTGSIRMSRSSTSSSSRRSKSNEEKTSGTAIEAIRNVIIDQIFDELNKRKKGALSTKEAELLLVMLNNRLKKSFEEEELKRVIRNMETNADGLIEMNKFRDVFMKIL